MSDDRRNEVAERTERRRQFRELTHIEFLEISLAKLNDPAAIVRNHRHMEVVGNAAILQVPVIPDLLRWVVPPSKLEAERCLLVIAVRQPGEESRLAGASDPIGR